MRTIRRGVFETNSSSTHSISIVAKEDFEKWQSGELLFDRYNKTFCKADEVDKQECPEDFESYEDFGSDYEYFDKSYKTKSGDEIVAFGYYGYDG